MAAPAQLEAEVVAEPGCTLGEGPWWDGEGERLLFVDIQEQVVHSWSETTGLRRERELGGRVGFAISRRGGGLVAGVERRLELIDADGGLTTLAEVEPDRDGNRLNDAKCDPAGRLWAGTMSVDREPGVAALYRVEPDGAIEAAVTELTISNGLGWSPDAETMYLIDSPTQRIDAFDFDLAAGRLGDRRPFAAVAAEDGLPDGLAVDADGGVWVALFGGGAVRRYGPNGSLDAELRLPTSNPTCPALGGADRRRLFVTTAKWKLAPEALAAETLAGALFAAPSEHAGLPLTRFAG